VDAQVHLWKAKSGDTVRFPDASNSNMDGTIFPRARAEFVVSDAIARTACVVSLVGKRHGVEGRTLDGGQGWQAVTAAYECPPIFSGYPACGALVCPR